MKATSQQLICDEEARHFIWSRFYFYTLVLSQAYEFGLEKLCAEFALFHTSLLFEYM